MSKKFFQQVKSITMATMELPEEEQHRYVRDVCDGDQRLEDAVWELVKAPTSLSFEPMIQHFETKPCKA